MDTDYSCVYNIVDLHSTHKQYKELLILSPAGEIHFINHEQVLIREMKYPLKNQIIWNVPEQGYIRINDRYEYNAI